MITVPSSKSLTMTRIFTTAILASVMLVACQKEVTTSSPNGVSEKVNVWLDEQKSESINASGGSTNKDANIDLLKLNLDFNSAKMAPRDQNNDYLIVPIKEELKTKKNLDRNSTLDLLIVMDKAGKIKWGEIVYFLPADGKKHNSLSPNTIQNIFNSKPADNGMFKFLSVTGKWINQIEYKNNRLYSHGIIESKKSDNTQRTTTICIDWYLVTTYHYGDGSTYQTWEYVGTTCDGCDNPDYQSLCPDGGGGGSGNTQIVTEDISSYEEEYESDDANAPKIIYAHVYTLQFVNDEVVNVIRYPVTATPMSIAYVDRYGRNTIRTLTLLAQGGSWMPLTATSGQVNWICDVYALYVYSNGNPSFAKQWTHTHSIVY